MDGFKDLFLKYPAWFQTFFNNLSLYFENIHSEGVLWVVEQRPPSAFRDLNKDQFKHYVFAAFNEVLQDLTGYL